MESTSKKIYPSVDQPWKKHLSKRAQNLHLPEGTMFDLIYENNKDYPNELALKYMDIQVTFAEMWDHIEEVVKSLNALGVRVSGKVRSSRSPCRTHRNSSTLLTRSTVLARS